MVRREIWVRTPIPMTTGFRVVLVEILEESDGSEAKLVSLSENVDNTGKFICGTGDSLNLLEPYIVLRELLTVC